MKPTLYLLFFTLTLLTRPQFATAQRTLPEYQVYFGRTPQGWLTLRRWLDDGRYSYWIVNPGNLRTSWYNGPVEPLTALGWHNATIGTPYGLALAQERLRSRNFQEAGLVRLDTTRSGFTLTLDLCTSSKPLNRQFFLELVEAFEKEERPVPVAITMTGTWMKDHPDDLGWLRQMNARRQLAVTWVNHGFHHPGSRSAGPLAVESAASLREDILRQEQAMLAIPLRPAVLFRFPGPSYTKAMLDSVLALGLLPLGSDTGNSNENYADLLRLVKEKSLALRGRQYVMQGK